MPVLKSISSKLPEPPHADVKAAGAFPFDLDVNRMLASDTWAITPAEIRPWCLMAWVISWTQTPVGSLPADEEILAVRLGCSRRMLKENRCYILRNWKLHSNDRLYHPVVSAYVTALGARRATWRKGQKNRRQENRDQQNQTDSANVNVDSTEIIAESTTSCSSSSSSSSSCSSSSSKPKARTYAIVRGALSGDLIPEGVDSRAWSDFCQHRREIRKPLKDLAARKNANVLRGLSPDEQRACVDRSIANGWTGLFPKASRRDEIKQHNDEFLRKLEQGEIG